MKAKKGETGFCDPDGPTQRKDKVNPKEISTPKPGNKRYFQKLTQKIMIQFNGDRSPLCITPKHIGYSQEQV